MNKLAGCLTGVAHYNRRLKSKNTQQQKSAVDEFRDLEEKRLKSLAGLTCFGRGLALQCVTELRHAECMEDNVMARVRDRLRKPRATLKPHKVWLASPSAVDGFEQAVGVSTREYLQLPRGDDEEREIAAELDTMKLKYYAKSILSVRVWCAVRGA